MSRAATTSDAFNAVAEPRRRQLLEALAAGETSVGELVDRLGMTQPQVSKHLHVLRSVGLVECRPEGRRRLYRVNGPALRPIHEWASRFEQLWSERLDRLDRHLAGIQKSEQRQPAQPAQ